MALKKEKKAEIVDKLSKALSKAASVVFVNFRGLNVADATLLRRKLRSLDIGYTVSKKTLLKRALSAKKFEGEIPSLEGEIAVAYPSKEGGDELVTAREVYNFHKDHKDAIRIAGGVFEGKYMDAKAMLSLATIPGRDVLIGQFVSLINSPIQRFAVVLNAIAGKKQ